MKKFLIILFFTSIFCTSIFADLIDGPANIRDFPNGKIIFSLNNVNVQCKDYKDWYYISLMVWLKKDDVIEEKQIKKGSILYDSNNNEIGKTLDSIVITAQENLLYSNTLGKFSCTLSGYTFNNNIQKNVKPTLDNNAISKEDYFTTAISMTGKAEETLVKADLLFKIAKTYLEINQKDKAMEISAKCLETTNTIPPNPNFVGNSYVKNNEKAYKLRNIALLYFQLGHKEKTLAIFDNAVEAAKSIQGCCDQYYYRDKALEDFASDFVDLGEYDRCFKTLWLTGEHFRDYALCDITDKCLAKNEIIAAKDAIRQIKNVNLIEQKSADIYLKSINLNNLSSYEQLIRAFQTDKIKCLGLAKLAIKYYQLKGESNNITDNLLNESIELAKKSKKNYERDELLAEISGRYAEVKQFEKGKSLALLIKDEGSKATALVNIAYQYDNFNFKQTAAALLKEASKIAEKMGPGLDSEEVSKVIDEAYFKIGLSDKSHDIAKFDNDILYKLAQQCCQDKHFEQAFDTTTEFCPTLEMEKKYPYDKASFYGRDLNKISIYGEIISNLNSNEKERTLNLISKITPHTDAFNYPDWYLFTRLKFSVYCDISSKLVEVGEYNQAFQIINDKLVSHDDKISASVMSILAFMKSNNKIDSNWDNFIKNIIGF